VTCYRPGRFSKSAGGFFCVSFAFSRGQLRIFGALKNLFQRTPRPFLRNRCRSLVWRLFSLTLAAGLRVCSVRQPFSRVRQNARGRAWIRIANRSSPHFPVRFHPCPRPVLPLAASVLSPIGDDAAGDGSARAFFRAMPPRTRWPTGGLYPCPKWRSSQNEYRTACAQLYPARNFSTAISLLVFMGFRPPNGPKMSPGTAGCQVRIVHLHFIPARTSPSSRKAGFPRQPKSRENFRRVKTVERYSPHPQRTLAPALTEFNP